MIADKTRPGDKMLTAQDCEIISRDVEIRGATQYRIDNDGSVHYYGPMPNTDVTGWYFVSFSVEDAVREINRSNYHVS